METLLKRHRSDEGIYVRSYRNHKLPFPNISNPEIVGCFSLNTNRDYEPNAGNLQYYKPPKLPFDLNEGYEKRIQKPKLTKSARLDGLLDFIYDNRRHLIRADADSSQPIINAEFICLRGSLRLIMCTPNEYRSDWCMHITKFKGNFYFYKKETASEEFERLNATEMQKRMTAWGYKFEQHCLSRSPDEDPITNVPVDESAEFICVYKRKIGPFQFLFGAEMDGIISDHPVDMENRNALGDQKFCELKVTLSKNRQNYNQKQSFCKFKSRNWWCQCFLVGIEDVYVGGRDNHGIVESVEHIKVQSLSKEGKNFWSPTVCAHFLIQFIEYVKTAMEGIDCPHTVYEFYFNPRESKVTFQSFNGKSIHTFLPDWYITQISHIQKNDGKYM